MANIIRIKRRTSGSAGAPAALKSAELAYNMVDNTVYAGYGDDGSGNATSVKPIGGEGTFAKLDSPALTGTPTAPTATGGTNTTQIATTQFVTSAISTAGSGYQPLDATLTALAGATTAADKLAYFSGTDTVAVTDFTSFGRSLVDDIDAAAARITLGLGTMATEAASSYLPISGGTITNNLTITGDLTVNGTTTTVNSTTVTVDDKNLELGSTASPTDAGADGGGITLKGTTDKTFNWIDSTDAWTSSEHLDLASGKAYYINGTQVLSGSALGSGVTSSSLTTVGTIGTGTWQGTAVALAYGGTGANLSAVAAGALLKVNAGQTALEAATAGTDYLNNASTVDGGTF